MTRLERRVIALCLAACPLCACASGGALRGSETTAGGSAEGGAGGSEAHPTGGRTNAGGSAAASNGGSAPAVAGAAAGGATSLPVCKIVYDGETGTSDVNLAAGTTWADPNGANGTSSVSESTDHPHSGARAMKIDLTWNTGYYGGAFGFNWAGYTPSRVYDLSGATQLEFWVRTETGTNDHFVLWLSDATGTASSRDQAGGYVPLVTSEWQHFSIPLSIYTGIDMTRVWELDGDTHSNPFGTAGGVTFYLDDIAFTGPSCP